MAIHLATTATWQYNITMAIQYLATTTTMVIQQLVTTTTFGGKNHNIWQYNNGNTTSGNNSYNGNTISGNNVIQHLAITATTPAW